MAIETEIERAIFELLRQRASGKSICPSEAARRVAPHEWRPLLDVTRSVARRLVEAGRLEVTQKGKPIDPDEANGPIRLRLAAETDSHPK